MHVTEYRNVDDLNNYLKTKSKWIETFIIPLERRFINPNTKLLTSTITYIVIEDKNA